MSKSTPSSTEDNDMSTQVYDLGEWLTIDPATFSERANDLWQSALAPDEDHPYLRKHGLASGSCWVRGEPGFVNDESIENSIVVPYYSGANDIAALRFISADEDGERRDVWVPDSSGHVGAYARLGEQKTDAILLTSSYSDGLSLFEATKYRVAIASNSAGLVPVAAKLASAHPKTRIVVCIALGALAESEAAARMIGAALATPATGTGFGNEDRFNSIYQQLGAEALRQIVDTAAPPKSDGAADGVPIDIAPWPVETSIAEIVQSLVRLIPRFSVVTEAEALIISMWILVSHVMDLMPFSPILGLFSPTKGCGKTTLLELLALLVRRPITAANMTAAYLYNIIEHFLPTLLIDEGDTFLARSSDLTGIINSGHSRAAGFVRKMISGKPKAYPAFCGKVLSMIGCPADTTYDRCIAIHLRRKLPEETVEPLYHADKAEFALLKSKITRWAIDSQSRIKMARPPRLKVRNSRTADNYVPLLMVASLGDEELLKRVTAAAENLAAAAGEQLRNDELLIRHVKAIFESTGRKWIWSQELVDILCQNEEMPWARCNRGRPLTPAMLAAMLGAFAIESVNIRDGETVKKGYKRSFFEDAFARYANGDSHD